MGSCAAKIPGKSRRRAGAGHRTGLFARNLLHPPNIPKLAVCPRRPIRLPGFVGRDLKIFQPEISIRPGSAPLPAPRTMINARGFWPPAGSAARQTPRGDFPAARHAVCSGRRVVEIDSQPVPGGVNCFHRPTRRATSDRGGRVVRCGGGIARSDRQRCRDLGAARNGYRKRTRVRVACGGAIRPRGVGTHSSHGHLGRSVVGNRFLPPFVLLPARRRQPGGRHLSRGPGLPAAALTTACQARFVRLSAPADRFAQATRPGIPEVNRATSLPGHIVGSSRDWRRRTRPDPRKRLRRI